MATNFCYYCQTRHDDTTWRSLFINNKLARICSLYFKPGKPEFVPQYIKDDRAKYAKSTLQPWHQGEASAEFIEAYPDKAKHMFTEKERLTAKSVWRGDISKDWRKSK